MLVFGMNTPGNLKWACAALLICYYFNHLRAIFNEHYEQQRRMLNINPQNEEVRVEVNIIEANEMGEIIDENQNDGNPNQGRRAMRRMMDRHAPRRNR